MDLFSYFVLDTLIVPETPGPSCTKPKSVVIVQESPCSVSDMDSSFGLINTGKSNVSRRDKSAGVLIGKDKESKNHPEVKEDINDDSIFEAETQCDIECLDMTKCSANTLHVFGVSPNGKVCASESDQEEDLFEAETQCEEPCLNVPVKSCSASDLKNQNLALRSEIIDAVDDDIYEAETQCVLEDIPNEKIRVNVVSKGKLDTKIIDSLEEKNVNICNTDRLVPKDADDSPNEHGDEIYDAPTQCVSGNGDKTTVMSKTDTVSVCSEKTEEYNYDDVSVSSPEDINIKLSVDRKVDITDSSILIERKSVGSENKVGEAPSSNKGDQQKEQPDNEGSSKVTKIALDVSFNEDSFDRSMLEGDDDLFTFEARHIDSKEAAFKNNNTAKTFREVHQEENKSKSDSTDSSDTQTNLVSLSKECTIKPSKSEKTVSGASEKCTSNKSELVQTKNDLGEKTGIHDAKAQNIVPLMNSLRPSNKGTPKLSNESGDETDPEDIFETKAQTELPLNRNKKGSTKSFHHSSILSSSDTPTTSSSNNSKLSAQTCNDFGDETDPEDIFEAKTQIVVPPVNNSKIISNRSEPSSSKISSETYVTINSGTQLLTESGNAKDQDRIFETQNQVVELQNMKNGEFTNPEDSSKQDSSKSVTNKPVAIRTEKVKTPARLSIEFKDNNSDDDIFCAPTQILSIPNENIDITKLPVSSTKETTDSSVKIPTQLHCASREHDDDDDDDAIFEAATQIVETPNRSSKDSTKISEPSSETEKTDIQAISDTDRVIQEKAIASEIKNIEKVEAPTQVHNAAVVGDDDDDDIFEAPTQIIEVPTRSSKDFTEPSKSSSGKVIINAPAVKYGSRVKAPKLVDSYSGNENDNILAITTQKMEIPNSNNKDFPKHSGSSSGKGSCHTSTPDKPILTQSSQKDSKSEMVPTRAEEDGINRSEILPSKKTIVTPGAQKDGDKKSDKVTLNTSNSVSEGAEGDIVKKSEVITSKKPVISPGVQMTDGKRSTLLESKTPIDISIHTQNNGMNDHEGKTPDASNSGTKKDRGRKSEMLESKKPFITSDVQKDGNNKTDIEAHGNVTPKAEGHCVNESEMGVSKHSAVIQCIPVHNDNKPDLIAPKLLFDEMVRTKSDAHTNADEKPGLAERKVPEDKTVSSEKDYKIKHRTAESKKLITSHRDGGEKPDAPESKKSDDASASVQRDSDGKQKMVVSRKTDDTKVTSEKSRVEKSGMAESVRPDTPKPEKSKGKERKAKQRKGKAKESKVKKAKEPHDSTFRAEKAGDGKPGMETSKKSNDSVVSTDRDDDGTSDMNNIKKPGDNMASDQGYFSGKPVISDSKKPSDIISTQKEGDPKCEVAGSKIPGDDKSSSHDGSGDETDPENFFETNSYKIKVERNSNNKLNMVKKSAVPIASGETAQSGYKNEAVCIENEHTVAPLSTVLQDTMPSSVSSTENKNESTLVTKYIESSTPLQLTKMSTKSSCVDVSCSKEEDSVVKSRGGVTPVLTVAASHDNSEPVDCGSNSVSCQSKVSTSSSTRTVMGSLPQDRSTESAEQKQNSDLQESMLPEHSKDIDESCKTPLGGTKMELDSKSLEPDNSSIQKEYDSRSHPDINQQIALEHERPISEEGGRVVDATDELIDDSLNDTFELIMPSSQDLMKAVKKSETEESPFKPEEVISSEDEEPSSPTFKITRHSHLPNNRAKVRKRLSTKGKGSDTTVVDSRRRHLPDKSSVHVSMISNTAAGTSRRRKLSSEDKVQSDTPNITLQASKQRKLSDKDSLQSDSKNKANDVTSHRRSRRCPGKFQQVETEDIVNTDKENGKGRKSKIVKGQDKTVALAGFQKETNAKPSPESSRRERSSQNEVERNEKKEQDFKSEQSNEPREGKKRLKQMVESTKDNDHKEKGKSRRERSVNKKENMENSLAANSRPSRQRKMTWKIQDSLGNNSQSNRTPGEEKSKSRSRGSLSSNPQNEINENLDLSTSRTVRSRNVSLSKSPLKTLLKSSEDSNDTSKDVKESKITDFVPGQQNVCLRKSTRQSTGGRAVTSMTDLSKNQSPQKQNDTEIISSKERKRKTEETVTEMASKRSKKVKSQGTSADKCSPEKCKSVLNTDVNLKDVCSESNTRVSGRKGRQTTNVEVMQEPSTVTTNICTVLTENGKQRPVLKLASGSSIDSVQSCAGRSVRKRTAVTNTSLSCLNKLNKSVFLNASSRPQRGVKRTKPTVEEDAEHLSAKQTKSEKRLSKTHSPSFESSVQNDKVESVQFLRTSRTRRKITSPQKSETTGTAKQDTKHGQRERTSRISKTDEAYKELKNVSVTPKSRKTDLSEDQDTTPQHARSSRGRGTPQSSSQLSSQKVSVTVAIVCEGSRKNVAGYQHSCNMTV
jgi:hypothetical protein